VYYWQADHPELCTIGSDCCQMGVLSQSLEKNISCYGLPTFEHPGLVKVWNICRKFLTSHVLNYLNNIRLRAVIFTIRMYLSGTTSSQDTNYSFITNHGEKAQNFYCYGWLIYYAPLKSQSKGGTLKWQWCMIDNGKKFSTNSFVLPSPKLAPISPKLPQIYITGLPPWPGLLHILRRSPYIFLCRYWLCLFCFNLLLSTELDYKVIICVIFS